MITESESVSGIVHTKNLQNGNWMMCPAADEMEVGRAA